MVASLPSAPLLSPGVDHGPHIERTEAFNRGIPDRLTGEPVGEPVAVGA